MTSDGTRESDLGLPASGPGSVAAVGARVVAFVLDLVTGALIGGLLRVIEAHPTDAQRLLAVNGAFALQVILLQTLTGQSVGMRLLGLRVHALRRAGLPGFVPVAVRTALLMLLLPALVFDRDGRGLHDRAAGTVVVRA
jgi:uncharacterized RDD family membrane protein YckC